MNKVGSHRDRSSIMSSELAIMAKTMKDNDTKDNLSQSSASETLMSTHSVKMGFYKINLGTAVGQKLHTAHLVVLPLIPVLILLFQNYSSYAINQTSINDLSEVAEQVDNALDFAELTRKLQEERVSVALNLFMASKGKLDTVADLEKYVESDVETEFIQTFKMENTFNVTDFVLQTVDYWPNRIADVDYFKTKLKFQIKHSLFRTKIREGNKSMIEVLDWYNEVNTKTLNYVTYSIHDSDVSDFYRWIIGYKNLLGAVEFAGKAGIHGLEYLTNERFLTSESYKKFLEYDVLRKEYLNQTFNFIPGLEDDYDDALLGNIFAQFQTIIAENDWELINDATRDMDATDKDLRILVKYFIHFLRYANSLRNTIINVAETIKIFVQNDMKSLRRQNILPLVFLVVLLIFIPICIMFTLNITSGMLKYSRLYNQKVEIYREERKKTDKLLSDLLPTAIIRQMKKGNIPKPEVFENTTIFFCDIVSFTNIAAESTAHQIIGFLNDL